MTVPLPSIYLLGLGLEEEPGARILRHPCLAEADVLVGGRRQLAFFSSHPAEKLTAGADIPSLLAAMEQNRAEGKIQVVLCGGDPLFFSLGGLVAARLEGVAALPAVGSLQIAAALLGLAWERVRSVSLHGRKHWLPLAHALASGDPVFVLTDAASSPGAVASFLRGSGYEGHRLHVFGDLSLTGEGLPRAGEQRALTVAEALSQGEGGFASARRVILLEPPAEEEESVFGLADENIDRDRDILTKGPARAAGLAALGIAPHHVVWDLGAGSGSVGLEAARLAWRGKVVAVEKNPARVAHIRANRRRFRAANLEILQGVLPGILKGEGAGEDLFGGLRPRPQRIFIGGGLGDTVPEAEGLLRPAWDLLLPGGRLVAHCVLWGSLDRARRILEELGGAVDAFFLQAGRARPLAGDFRFEGQNPVFMLRALK
ncbi:MAG: precorrin-6y C5,15-methyltransferase (decarboxylating) subunit CbiE [Desulfovibrio sp.]|jgi:precorrin-6Y C5,15-methyltransferase (decarboxylating)|nr:precorrin-6y C5,15-methyltransferase (decarboxylating) subunit CbiE [Desulfovibrio sp.]